MSGIKGSAIQIATGAVAELGNAAIAGKVGFIGQNWWAGPGGMALLGILMKKRRRLAGLGDAMLGAAGYAGAMNYTMAQMTAGHAPETAALLQPGDVGALMGSGYAPLNDQLNPTSEFYVPPDAEQGSVDAAMVL